MCGEIPPLQRGGVSSFMQTFTPECFTEDPTTKFTFVNGGVIDLVSCWSGRGRGWQEAQVTAFYREAAETWTPLPLLLIYGSFDAAAWRRRLAFLY